MAELPRSDGLMAQIMHGMAYFNLRGSPDDAGFVLAANTVLDQELPLAANTFSHGRHRVFWLGPDEWLIVSDAVQPSGLLTQMHRSLAGIGAAVTDISGGQLSLRLRGEPARDVLAKGCTLDLYAQAFKVGDCAQCGLAKTNVLIALINDRPEFEIIVRRSFAGYLALWLKQAGREFGMEYRVP